MPLLARTVTTPLTVEIRRGAIDDLAGVLSDWRISAGGQVAIVVGPGLGEQVVDRLRPSLPAAKIFTVAGGTLAAADELIDALRGSSFDAVVGIGGGKTIDTSKYAANRCGLPMVSVATSLAHDGIASPISVLDHQGKSGSYGVHIPIAVVVDLDYVKDCPDRQTRSGIGDAVSNLNAIRDWELSHTVRGEPVDGLAATLARTGAQALVNHPGGIDDDGFLTTLAEALVLGGMAMAVCGSSRPCSGGCHEISHALDKLCPGVASHGEQVGLGALFCTFLHNTYLANGVARFAEIGRCLARHGLPRVPAELGLSSVQFVQAVLAAPQTRPDRYTILEHLSLGSDELMARLADYVDAVDALG